MDDKTKNTVDNHDKMLMNCERFLTRFVVCYAPTMPRKELILYYEKMKNIYGKLENVKKILDYQKRIDEIQDSKKYLEMLELEYEARCEHFAGDEKTINTIHENLINVCDELGLTDKATYYKTRLSEWLERK